MATEYTYSKGRSLDTVKPITFYGVGSSVHRTTTAFQAEVAATSFRELYIHFDSRAAPLTLSSQDFY